MDWLLGLCFIIFLCDMPTYVFSREANYAVMIPRKIRPGLIFDASVQILTSIDSPINVMGKFTSKDGEDVLVSGKITINSRADSQQVLSLKIPRRLRTTTYQFTVTGRGGLTFRKRVNVTVSSKTLIPLIQTDKAIYQPGQTVKYRVMAVYPDLKPYQRKYDIFIKDKNNNLMDQELGVNGDEAGVYVGRFDLSDQPVLGDWKIQIETKTNEQKTKYFTVKEYVLPKIEVTVDGPSFWHNSMRKLPITITAKYTFGQPVRGTVVVRLYLRRKTWSWRMVKKKRRNAYKVIKRELDLIDGMAEIILTSSDIKDLYKCEEKFTWCTPLARKSTKSLLGSYPYTGTDLIIKATVTESVTGDTYMGDGEVPLESQLLNLRFMDNTPDTYKEGLVWVGYLQLTRKDGTPPLARDLKGPKGEDLKIWVKYKKREIWRAIFFSVRNYTVPETGIVKITVNAKDIDFSSLDIQARFPHNAESSEQVSDYMYLDKFSTKANEGIQVNIQNQPGIIKPSDKPVTFQVKTTAKYRHYYYQIISKGTIIAQGKSSEQNFKILFNPEFAQKASPNARIIVWYIAGKGEIIVDSIEFKVDGTFVNNVTSTFSKDTVEPGETVSVTAKASPGSHVFFLAIDQSVLLLKEGNDITRKQVVDGLQSFDSSSYYRWCFFCWWPIFSGGQSTADVIRNAGVFLLTDGYIHDEPVPWRVSSFSGTNMVLSNGGGGRGIADDVAASRRTTTTQIEQPVRDFFPETWIWTDSKVNKNGEVTINAKAPDTITSWVLSSFAMSRSTGLGIDENNPKLTVFKAFFAQINLPYSAIRNEELQLKVVVFNYLSRAQSVTIILSKNDGYYAAGKNDRDLSKPRQLRQVVKVPAEDGVEVAFTIKPVKVGQLSVWVNASSNQAFDSIRRMLLVEAEGEPHDYSKTLFVQVNSTTTYSQRLNIRYPDDVVPDSQRVLVTAIGDIMGPTIANIGNLVRMPYGCGEQNMVNFAPNVYILDYMKATGKRTASVWRKAIGYIKKGYQRQMRFQRIDGSFSGFGYRDRTGSMWLTAFVLRCFQQAKSYITIDQKLIDRGADFIVRNADRDGSFSEPRRGSIMSVYLQGNAGRGIPLTAYVAKVLHEIKDDISDMSIKRNVTRAITKVKGYLEQRLDSIEDEPYALSLVCYFFVAVKSSKADTCMRYFNRLAINKDWSRYWKSERERRRFKCRFWCYPYRRATPSTVEMSAYGLLTYVLRGNLNGAALVVKYLSSQRSSLGGYSSTQDTVVGLQALSTFAALSSGQTLNIDISLRWESSGSYSFETITSENSAVFHQRELPSAGSLSSLTVNAGGEGTALVQMTVFFNRANAEEPQGYELNVKTNLTGKNIYLTVCAKYLLKGASGMVVMEVNMLTGYVPVTQGLENKYEGIGLRKVEVDQKKVVFYWDKVTAKQLCIELQTVKQFVVQKVQPAVVVIYSYYRPEVRTSALYLPKELE